jgi:predicted DNA-binding transcriptional regulator AlpA
MELLLVPGSGLFVCETILANYLTLRQSFDIVSVLIRAKNYTTAEAASKIGVSRQTLHSWIVSGRVVAPNPIEIGKNSIRLWTKVDIDEARKFKGTLKPGPQSKKKKKKKSK